MRRCVCLAELTELDKLARLASDGSILQEQKNHDLLSKERKSSADLRVAVQKLVMENND